VSNQLSIAQVHQYFPDFVEPELQEEIANLGQIHHFKEGDVIMDYGGYVRMLPLILTGTIKISRQAEDGSELFLYYLSRGESCTMTFTCCLSDKVSEIQAVAEEETMILALPQKKLDEWMMTYKSWKNFVMLAYDQRMREMMTTIDQIAFNQLDVRLLDYLKRRTEVHQNNELKATHQSIADDLNVSREAISRLLKGLEKRGVIELGRNRVKLILSA
jgi:CRP/FNR family transcriptional regulator